MNKTTGTERAGEHLPRAKIKKDRTPWLFWLIPIGAAALCVWFAYRDFISMGPSITITFENGEGLEAKNTALKYRGVTVGEMKAFGLTEDGKHVAVTVRMTGAAKKLPRAGSAFWIVHPDVKVGMISGLRTIVSGEYIEMRPGNGPVTNRFAGDQSEPLPEKLGALMITLVAAHLGSLQEQSPIFYRGIQVGELMSYQLAPDSRQVIFRARIWPEYASLVRPESKFWNAGGVDFHFGLFKGFQMSAESPKTLIAGGIEFATPPESKNKATDGIQFELNEKPDDKWKAWAPEIQLDLPEKAEPAKFQDKQTNDLGTLKTK